MRGTTTFLNVRNFKCVSENNPKNVSDTQRDLRQLFDDTDVRSTKLSSEG
jgi:hypothetical protein